jgi:hypothetical protein
MGEGLSRSRRMLNSRAWHHHSDSVNCISGDKPTLPCVAGPRCWHGVERVALGSKNDEEDCATGYNVSRSFVPVLCEDTPPPSRAANGYLAFACHLRDGACSRGADRSHVTCEMVRAHVAQIGLVQAEAMAQTSGLTETEKRQAIQCLRESKT